LDVLFCHATLVHLGKERGNGQPMHLWRAHFTNFVLSIYLPFCAMMCYGNQTTGTKVQRRKQWTFGESFTAAFAHSKENPIDLNRTVFFQISLETNPNPYLQARHVPNSKIG